MASPNGAVVAVGGGTATPAKARGRKGGKSGAAAQKKQPQRGMGVAQLEKLRQQEQQRNHLFEFNSALHSPVNPFLPHPGFAVPKPMIRCPDSNAALLSCAFTNNLQQPDYIQVDPREERRVRVLGGGFKPELPSIPNVHDFDLNTFNFKKKKINGLDLEVSLASGRDTNYCQGVEVLAIHPKDRNVVMEYGFFPVTPSSANGSGSTSSPASSSAHAAAPASIDLSLKL